MTEGTCSLKVDIHPRGMTEGSRSVGAKRRPPETRQENVHPGGMPVTRKFERSDRFFDRLKVAYVWHALRGAAHLFAGPAVSAALRPPATLCHPSGMVKVP